MARMRGLKNPVGDERTSQVPPGHPQARGGSRAARSEFVIINVDGGLCVNAYGSQSPYAGGVEGADLLLHHRLQPDGTSR